MSLPQFPKKSNILTRDQALDAILTSIAMEEVALSHIINAEGEKIQYILKAAKENKADVCDVLEVNESVSSMLEQVNDIQITLKNKLRWALKYLPKPEETPRPLPPRPKPPCPKPKPPCPEPKPPCSCQHLRPPWLKPAPPCSCQNSRPPWLSPKPPCSCQNLRPPWLGPMPPCSCQKCRKQNKDFC